MNTLYVSSTFYHRRSLQCLKVAVCAIVFLHCALAHASFAELDLLYTDSDSEHVLKYDSANGDQFGPDVVYALADGEPTFIRFNLSSKTNLSYTGSVTFAVNKILNESLVPGVYSDFQRAAVATSGNPGFDFGLNFVLANTDYGSFTIDQAIYQTNTEPNTVLGFEATFVLHQDSPTAPEIDGHFYYNVTPSVVPEPSTLILCTVGVFGLLFACRRQLFGCTTSAAV